MKNLLNKEVNVTIGNTEYKGIVTDFNNDNVWVDVEIDGYKDSFNFKLEEIKEVEESFENDLDKLAYIFKNQFSGGVEDTAYFTGKNYEVVVELTKYKGKKVFNLETINLNKKAVKTSKLEIGEFVADILEECTANATTRSTFKGAMNYLEKWLWA